MNYSTAILLINPACRAIRGIYEPDPEKAPGSMKRHTFKTFDKSISVGDLILVPSGTRWDVTTMKVTDVDVEWEPDTVEHIRWVIGIVDKSGFQKLLDAESQAIQQIKEAEKTHKRNELKDKMMAHIDPAAQDKIAQTFSTVAISPPK